MVDPLEECLWFYRILASMVRARRSIDGEGMPAVLRNGGMPFGGLCVFTTGGLPKRPDPVSAASYLMSSQVLTEIGR